MQTADDLFRLSCERAPGHAAIVDTTSGRRLDYGELRAEVEALAAGLAELGIGSGTRVATVLPNVLEHCLALLALQRLGAVPALVNARLKPEQIGRLIEHGELAAAIVMAAPPLVKAARKSLPAGAALLTVGGAEPGAGDLMACRAPADRLAPPPRPDPEETAFIFYTSGTTGLPKGALIPHRAVESRVLFLCPQAGFRHGTHNRLIGIMPLAHSIGYFGVFLAALALDGSYYVVPAFDPVAVLDIVESEAITSIFASPTHYHALLEAPNFSAHKVRSLELVLYGGASMSAPLQERVDGAFAATVRHIYGTTETMNSLYNPDPVGRPNTLRPGFYSSVRVARLGAGVDDLTAPGEEGEILVDARADATFSGYLNRPDATALALVDGWHRTGDVGSLDENGDIVLKGRVDDMINSGAENIHPEEVETVLLAHPDVREAALVGSPDERWGEIGVACVVRGRPELGLGELDEHCRASALADFKRPRGYVFLDSLPRNAANKVLRRELREMVAAARAGEGEASYHRRGG
jgi:acyl-CoA synthetase (AMP-forming)/AMP-acid ligase II